MNSDKGNSLDRQWLASVLPSQQQLEQLLGNDPATALLGLARSRAPVVFDTSDPGDDPALQKEFALAQAAAAALKKDRDAKLSPEQVQALHALVHLLLRPALPVIGGAIPAIPQSWERLDRAHDLVVRNIRGVGRIDTSSRVHVGTGWFVAENLLMTNRHVAGCLCGLDVHYDPDWLGKLPAAVSATNATWAADPSRRAIWDPADAPGAAGSTVGSVTRIRAYHAQLDMALLDVTGIENSRSLVLKMQSLPPVPLARHEVYIAGYPAVSPPHAVSEQVAKLLFPGATASGLKRVSPGEIVALVEDLPVAANKPRASHDSSTLGGSSGSPVINFDNHRVVALHYGGQYGVTNLAVPLWLVSADPFFTDNGIEFAS